jgi:hypothetical protein
VKRALLILTLLPTVAVSWPAMAAGPKEPVCIQASTIENWRVHGRRAVSIDVRTPDKTQDTLIVTFLHDCFAGWPYKAMRVEARGSCLAPGDSMTFNFPPTESETEKRCVVKTIRPPAPSQTEEPPTCDWRREKCY